jgi:hypothetical protein
MPQCSKFGEQFLRGGTRVEVCENVHRVLLHLNKTHTECSSEMHFYIHNIYACVYIYIYY